MKTIRSFFIVFAIVSTVVSFLSCIENNLTAEVELGEVAIKIPIYFELSEREGDLVATENLRPFTGKLDKLSLKDTVIFSGFADFQTLPKQVFIKNVRIQLKKENALKGSLINGIKSTAFYNYNGNEISSYEKTGVIDFETEYLSDPKLTNFVKDIFAFLEEDKAVNIVLSGMTDIEAEEDHIQIGEINILVELSANIELK